MNTSQADIEQPKFAATVGKITAVLSSLLLWAMGAVVTQFDEHHEGLPIGERVFVGATAGAFGVFFYFPLVLLTTATATAVAWSVQRKRHSPA